MAYLKSWKYALLFGFLLWLIPFLVSIMIFPLHDTNRPFFETIMPLTLTLFTVLFTILYFKDLETEFLKESVIVGVIWLAFSLIIDLIMFLPPSPMMMSVPDYMMDIGLTYLILPIITIGFGYLVQNRQ